jgi:hypothetical protein
MCIYLFEQWKTRLREMSPWAAFRFANQEVRYTMKMRYQGNILRGWFTPEELAAAGAVPLVELSVPKDGWVSPEAEVLAFPLLPPEMEERAAKILFNGVDQGVREPNPEIPGGRIALIATNSNLVQEPQASLERIHAFLSKQIAFNRRILKTEDEISGINAEMRGFLQEMSLDPRILLYVCVNFGHTMRGSQLIWGQLWAQKSRQFTATNHPGESDGADGTLRDSPA